MPSTDCSCSGAPLLHAAAALLLKSLNATESRDVSLDKRLPAVAIMKPVASSLLLLLLLHVVAALALPPPAHAPPTIYVDCSHGSNIFGDGSASSPLSSPNAARDLIRSLQPLTSDVTAAGKMAAVHAHICRALESGSRVPSSRADECAD
jgi:hypothetical protein